MDQSPYDRKAPVTPAGVEAPWDMKLPATALDRSNPSPVRPRRPGLY
jgi:hypothetical protein